VSVRGFLRRLWRPTLFQGIAFVSIAGYFLLLYVVPPIRFYNIFWLQNFDYGILYNSSQMLAHLQAPFVTTRGTHSWADNQDYFQVLLGIFHHLPYPHYSLLVSHALAIFACGVFCFLFLRREGLVALLLPLVVWMSPYLVNMNLDLFHTEAYATILLLLMFYGATHGRPWCFAIATLLALACKEDVAITVGTFMTLALLRPGFFQLQRRYLVAGLAASVLVFVINQGVVLPYFKLRTCEWLNADFSRSNMRAGPTAPWFADIWSQLLNPSYYKIKFASPGVMRYLLTLLWPMVFFARSTFPISLLPLPGAFINIFGSGYLIQSRHHYDHSTYAAVIIVMLLGIRRVRFKKTLGTVLVLIAAWINLHTPLVRMKVTTVRTPEFWSLEKDERTRFVELLNELLPPDIVISADYTALNYLLRGRDTVYMFENPFRPDYFGIYGLCDGVVGVYRTVPTPDIAVVRGDYTMAPKVREILDTAYENWTVYPFGGRHPMNLFINPRSKQYGRLVSVARELGADEGTHLGERRGHRQASRDLGPHP
jgi:uncharacterized membrane protein